MKRSEKYERMMDYAKRLCFKGYPNITKKRRKKLWSEVEGFLQACVIDEKATGWEMNANKEGNLPCDLFMEHFEQYDVSDSKYEREIENKFFVQLRIICRSACDSLDGWGGVLAFNKGDLLRTFDGELPPWMMNRFKKIECKKASDKELVML